ncbi:serine threonine kinase [Penicillium taxi]|uniref:serine threonine kinase n=1 Tax=Penicillium taxi TaxID=168475 RepID=UPI0025454BBC|nr:serine threonine kinase [Penicillium taxi]KAJ5888873.1 serine threonine kinase [Penicillium taxi]
MGAFYQIFFLILSFNAFLPFAFAAHRSLRPIYKPDLLNRRDDVPTALDGWALYSTYNDYCETNDDSYAEVPDASSQGTVDNAEKRLTYYSEFDCEDRTLTWSSLIAQTVYSSLFKAKLDDYDQDVVMKRSRGQGPLMLHGASLQQQFSGAINILDVIDYVWVSAGRKAGYLIMPYISDGSVADKLDTYSASGQDTVNKAFKQILTGVNVIQAAGVMHRDIKPANVLIDGDTLKLADFDYSLQKDTSNEYAIGTDGYIAPEVVRMTTYDMKVDTFALGMTWMVMSVPSLADNNNEKLLLLWKSVLTERDGNTYLEASQVEDTLNSYEVLQKDATLRSLIAKTLCGPDERLTVAELYTQFSNVAGV